MEPGKGSYWMINLTQDEGNKQVHRCKKKLTNRQLAIQQAAAKAYHASMWIPSQGDGPCPMPYPILSHAPTQLQIVEEDSRGKMY